MLSHGLVIAMAGSHPSTHSSTSATTPSATANFGASSKHLSFFQPWFFFFGGLPFALLVLQFRAAFI
jgi:hypothetical protein